jgi:hypothetical protein
MALLFQRRISLNTIRSSVESRRCANLAMVNRYTSHSKPTPSTEICRRDDFVSPCLYETFQLLVREIEAWRNASGGTIRLWRLTTPSQYFSQGFTNRVVWWSFLIPVYLLSSIYLPFDLAGSNLGPSIAVAHLPCQPQYVLVH